MKTTTDAKTMMAASKAPEDDYRELARDLLEKVKDNDTLHRVFLILDRQYNKE